MAAFEKFLNSAFGSFLKVFLAVVLGAFVSDLAGLTKFGDVFSNWQGWLIAGFIAAVPILINALNPSDPRYGKVAPQEDPNSGHP